MSGLSAMRSTRAHQHIKVKREDIYRLPLDPSAIGKWKVPDGMKREFAEGAAAKA